MSRAVAILTLGAVVGCTESSTDVPAEVDTEVEPNSATRRSTSKATPARTPTAPLTSQGRTRSREYGATRWRCGDENQRPRRRNDGVGPSPRRWRCCFTILAALVLPMFAVAAPGCGLPGAALLFQAEDTVEMGAVMSSRGWWVTFSGFAEPPSNIRVTVERGETILLDDPQFLLPKSQEECDLALNYDRGGKDHGPLTFHFSPRQQHIDFAKDVLGRSRSVGWVSWRRYRGKDIVYFVTLLLHGCALERVEYSFDDTHWEVLPTSCEHDRRAPGNDTVTALANRNKEVLVRLTFVDGTVWTAKAGNPNYGSEVYDERDRDDDGQGGRRMAVEQAARDLVSQCSTDSDTAQCHRFGDDLFDDLEQVQSKDVPVPLYCEAGEVSWVEVIVGKVVLHVGYAKDGDAWVPRRIVRTGISSGAEDLCSTPLSEPVVQAPVEPEEPGPAVSWTNAAISMEPCWALEEREIYARVWGSDKEELESVARALSETECRRNRDRLASFLAVEHPAMLEMIDAMLAAYEKTAALHRSYAEIEFPRAKDLKGFKADVGALLDGFPSMDLRTNASKEVLDEVLKESRALACRGSVERLGVLTRGIERAFEPGLPIKNARVREGARDRMAQIHARLRDDCPGEASEMVRTVGALVDLAGLILDHHQNLRRSQDGEAWRSPRVRVSDSETRLEQACLGIYVETGLFVASQSKG